MHYAIIQRSTEWILFLWPISYFTFAAYFRFVTVELFLCRGLTTKSTALATLNIRPAIFVRIPWLTEKQTSITWTNIDPPLILLSFTAISPIRMKNLSITVNFHDCQVTEEYLAIFKNNSWVNWFFN